MDLLVAALRHAQAGFAVFPLAAGSKIPKKGSRGFKDATKDEAQIRAWWEADPTANIGLATGTRSGVVVVDVDPRNGGDETWAAIEGDHGPQGTLSVVTPRRGRHLYYRLPTGAVVRSGANVLGAGVDVRGDGGYVVAPPSRTADGEYFVDGGDDLETLDRARILPWPGFLSVAGPIPAGGNGMVPWDDGKSPARKAAEEGAIPSGLRNDALISLAGTMRERGMAEASILAALRAENETKCNPPLPDEEVARVARSVMRYAPGTPVAVLPTSSDRKDTLAALNRALSQFNRAIAIERIVRVGGEKPIYVIHADGKSATLPTAEALHSFGAFRAALFDLFRVVLSPKAGKGETWLAILQMIADLMEDEEGESDAEEMAGWLKIAWESPQGYTSAPDVGNEEEAAQIGRTAFFMRAGEVYAYLPQLGKLLRLLGFPGATSARALGPRMVTCGFRSSEIDMREQGGRARAWAAPAGWPSVRAYIGEGSRGG